MGSRSRCWSRGTDGGIITDAQIERYRENVPGVEVAVIAGAGHDLFRPDRTAYPWAVLDFLSQRRPWHLGRRRARANWTPPDYI